MKQFRIETEYWSEQIAIHAKKRQIILFCKDNRPRTFDGDVTGQGVIELPSTPADSAVDFVCPNAPFGYYFSNRLIVPHYDDSPTTVAFSDVFELCSFDLSIRKIFKK